MCVCIDAERKQLYPSKIADKRIADIKGIYYVFYDNFSYSPCLAVVVHKVVLKKYRYRY